MVLLLVFLWILGFWCFWFSDYWCFGFWGFLGFDSSGILFSVLALGLRTCLEVGFNVLLWGWYNAEICCFLVVYIVVFWDAMCLHRGFGFTGNLGFLCWISLGLGFLLILGFLLGLG